jgi:hypothetical protein
MPIQYIVLDEDELVYARACGTLTQEDLIEHERSVLQDERIHPGFKQLLDCRWVKDDQIGRGVLTALSELHSEYQLRLRGSRYAVVTHNAAWFRAGVEHDFDRYGITMIIFNDPSTACIWLGVDYQVIAQYGWLDISAALRERPWVVGVSTH